MNKEQRFLFTVPFYETYYTEKRKNCLAFLIDANTHTLKMLFYTLFAKSKPSKTVVTPNILVFML